MKNCVIVIPIYKATLDCVEEISLNRLHDIIGDKYNIYLVAPKGLDTSKYDEIYKRHIDVVFFPQYYFTSTAAYSQLCINYNFYDKFSEYNYMLIYQLDCYLCYDNIEYWCTKNYDYIGGPILSTACGWDTIKNKNGNKEYQPLVGNGGFSLRKIETFKYLTDPNGEFLKICGINKEQLNNVIFEDKWFCNDLYNYYDLNIPDWLEALSFGIDMSVDIVYDLYKIPAKPMGIHSVDKNIRYWQNVLPEFKNPDVIAYCEEKHREFFKLYYDENNRTWRE